MLLTTQLGSFCLVWEAAPYTATGVASLPHPQTFDKMMGGCKYLVSVVLSCLSREIAYVFHFTPWSRTLAVSRAQWPERGTSAGYWARLQCLVGRRF
jgi:hypothetical protein